MKKKYGLEIGNIKKKKFIQNLFFKKKYQYSIIRFNQKKNYKTNKINIGSIVVFASKNKNAEIKINDKIYKLTKFKFFDFQFKELNITSDYKITIGIAGIKKKVTRDVLKKLREQDIHKVKKPWGYELWINGEKPTYSFKKIFIKKSNRTSLQFHKKKVETNYLFKGKAELTMSKKNGKQNKDLILKNIVKNRIKEGNFININNYAVHRIKAISDIILYEVSTPHLNDVIRIADDKNRSHGKIASEHLNKN